MGPEGFFKEEGGEGEVLGGVGFYKVNFGGLLEILYNEAGFIFSFTPL